jgi:hypothetical protein
VFLDLPYVEKIFDENIPQVYFDEDMRNTLIALIRYNWRQINPLIFGSIFQYCLSEEERHNLGAHFTSKENILKVIKPLFLDNLYEEFNKSENDVRKLRELHRRIKNIRVLDPACGSANFLVVSYMELKILERRITDITEDDPNISIYNFYGIELNEFAVEIGRLALRISAMKATGKFNSENPLIFNDNSLTRDWNTIIPKEELSYIIGNPPFVAGSGVQCMSLKQKEEMLAVFKKPNKFDYVTAWFKKASDYIEKTKIEVGFVATSGIAGVGLSFPLWEILNKNINFAYSQFAWHNEGMNEAQVNVVIIGFADFKREVLLLNGKQVKNILPNLDECFEVLKVTKEPLFFDKKCCRKTGTKKAPISVDVNDICIKRHISISEERLLLNFKETSCDTLFIKVSDATFFEYGILASKLFWLWTKKFSTLGLKTMLCFSPNTYNCFPLLNLMQEQKDQIAEYGVQVFLNKSLENCKLLDDYVTGCYGFNEKTEEEQVRILYELYKEKICQG